MVDYSCCFLFWVTYWLLSRLFVAGCLVVFFHFLQENEIEFRLVYLQVELGNLKVWYLPRLLFPFVCLFCVLIAFVWELQWQLRLLGSAVSHSRR